MLVGVASLPPSLPPSGTFYSINRSNCLYICNTVTFVVELAVIILNFKLSDGITRNLHYQKLRQMKEN